MVLTTVLTGLHAFGALASGAGADIAVVNIEPGVSSELAKARRERISALSYALTLRIPKSETADLEGMMVLRFHLADAGEPLQLDFRTPDRVQSLRSGPREISYKRENEHLLIPAAALTEGANTFTIEFTAPQDTVNRNPDFLFTLFVPDRARSAFPLFDQPDLKARFNLRLEVPEGWTALSNGRTIGSATVANSTGEGPPSRVFEFAETQPIPSYLFSFVAGEFESITRTVSGRKITMLHRETDQEKVARNVDAIFSLHSNALRWLEDYTEIDYPFGKFDFVLIPDFPYGGMEHVGAIQYRAASLLLDENPTENQRLNRAQLIAHETAHMWFGNLVTMRWFNDVWTKEVFANFMADKIVNPEFPDIDHELSFLVSHYPQAYAVDRTQGANAIRQALGNLNQAGQLYGPIIYHKAPIMMRQLELLIGADKFQQGIREYLKAYAYANADWPSLIAILDRYTSKDLATWSDVWVATPGMRELSRRRAALRNQDAFAYGRLAESPNPFEGWFEQTPLERGARLINAYENLLAGDGLTPVAYFKGLGDILSRESNDLLLELAAEQLSYVYFSLLPAAQRSTYSGPLESSIWDRMMREGESGSVKLFFKLYSSLAVSDQAIDALYDIWRGEWVIPTLNLSEGERISLAERIAVRSPERADAVLKMQLAQISNPDRRRRLEFIAPALSASTEERDRFFNSLANPDVRRTERWVASALRKLHDPTRIESSLRYLARTLSLLEEIQVTGDIFFPSAWLNASFGTHTSPEAAKVVYDFLASNPGYSSQLRMKILQAADPLFRAASE